MLRAATELEPGGVECRLYDGLGRLPAFNPDDDREPFHLEIGRLRKLIHEADALVFSTPEYAGALPGAFKNLLDWTIGDQTEGSIYGKPVSWINASGRGAAGAHAELRTVLGYASARIVEDACVQVPVIPTMVDEDGLISDADSRRRIGRALAVLARSTRPTRGSREAG